MSVWDLFAAHDTLGSSVSLSNRWWCVCASGLQPGIELAEPILLVDRVRDDDRQPPWLTLLHRRCRLLYAETYDG